MNSPRFRFSNRGPRLHRSIRRRAFGFTLIEMVACLLLLGVFSFVATRVFIESFNLNKLALQTTAAIERLDGAIRRLRRDAWDAVTFKAPSEQQLLITQNPDTHITWTVNASGDLTRAQTSPAAPTQTWSNLPPIRISIQNRAVLLAITENDQTQQMILPSQVSPPETMP